MNTLRNFFAVGLLFLIGSPALATSDPTFHTISQHHYATLRIPSSDHPVTVKVTDGQQQVFFHLTLESPEGTEKSLDFSWVPAGHYFLEVNYEGKSFYKTIYVRPDRVGSLDASVTFRSLPDARL